MMATSYRSAIGRQLARIDDLRLAGPVREVLVRAVRALLELHEAEIAQLGVRALDLHAGDPRDAAPHGSVAHGALGECVLLHGLRHLESAAAELAASLDQLVVVPRHDV